MDGQLTFKPQIYHFAVIFSVLFTLLGFTYNVWRMEVSEHNNTIRTASFEMLLELSSLEQLVFTAHYDGDLNEGSPRKGWVKVGLISDLSVLTQQSIKLKTDNLTQVWSAHWSTMSTDEQSVNLIVNAVDSVRGEIKSVLSELQ